MIVNKEMFSIASKALFIAYLVVLSINAYAETLYNDRVSWESTLQTSAFTETFKDPIINADEITLAFGAVSTGSIGIGNTNNEVIDGRWQMRIYNPGGSNGYQMIVLTLPQAVSAIAMDVQSISSSRGVKVSGNWDGTGQIITDLRNHIGQSSNGFFGVTGSNQFNQIILFADDGSVVGDDLFSIDNLSFPLADDVFMDGFE